MNLFAIRIGMSFQPSGDADREKAAHVKEGEICKISVSQPRNLVRHRHFFAMLREVRKQWPEKRGACPFATDDALLDALKEAIGWVEPFTTISGKRLLKLKSIAFENCDQPEFMEKVWNPCVDLMAQMLYLTRDELTQNTRFE